VIENEMSSRTAPTKLPRTAERTASHDHTAEVREARIGDDEGVGANDYLFCNLPCAYAEHIEGAFGQGPLRLLRRGRQDTQPRGVSGGLEVLHEAPTVVGQTALGARDGALSLRRRCRQGTVGDRNVAAPPS
jgi:hypothetical protein